MSDPSALSSLDGLQLHWPILVVSGVLEAVWAAALAASQRFRRPVPSAIFVVALALSMAGLAHAMTAIPVGTAYAVWVGIGALLAVVWSMITGAERITRARVLLLLGLVMCVVGLKVVA
ncbi:Quaternary ammonium compound-resistance protein SugE [Serinibacter arcticus]|uniref:Quaternary ammonium compound-resistance protein SugE n=1 Tax=Serinibacter arcticus TaxID=1655435 RepID=A0A4Z1E246_9MICO|nr:Quaternary ammonium compound-resistance protein SugE [Serinibacter arcticus]